MAIPAARLLKALLSIGVLGSACHVAAQAPVRLTLEDAEQIALKSHPRLGSAALNAQAAEKRVTQVRSAYFPTFSANVTGAGAEQSTSVAAGNVTTSALSTRFATGVALTQLATDFGRTSNLSSSAKLEARAQNSDVSATRVSVLIDVRRAYFGALGAAAVLRAAQANLENRRLLLRQVRALANSALKSTLDVTFAEVSVSEAELAVSAAQSQLEARQADLSASLGSQQSQQYELIDQPLPAALPGRVDDLVDQALRSRPDLQALRLRRDAASQFQKAERKLSYPTVQVMGVAGVIPEHDRTLHGDYGAAAVNVSIPVFNGGLFGARNAEAHLRALAAEKEADNLALTVSRDVRVAWLRAQDAYRRLDVTSRLIRQAQEALRLARARYDMGLGGIVELNQAQTSETSAEIDAASAKYDYLSRRAELDGAIGVLK